MLENNFLSPLEFRLNIDITPNVNYMVQQVSVPGLTLGSASMPTQLGLRMSNPGNLRYDEELKVTFKVGENLTDYLEVFNWMVTLSHPDNMYTQYKNISSDASVIIMNSAKKPIISVHFTDLYPTYLSNINFDTTLTDLQYVTATASFNFNRFYYDTI